MAKAATAAPLLAHGQNRFAYSSTQRTGKDTDIWTMDATDPKSAHLLLQVDGGGLGARRLVLRQ